MRLNFNKQLVEHFDADEFDKTRHANQLVDALPGRVLTIDLDVIGSQG